jgi:cytochrome P450
MTGTAPPEGSPVEDWETDFDHTTSAWAADATDIWDDLRERCPVAHSDRFGGTWLPTRHEDISAIAHDTEHFTSQGVIVAPFKPVGLAPVGYAPPITSDPPFHEFARRILLPAFSPKAVAPLEESTRAFCASLMDQVVAAGPLVDASVDYAEHIPVRVIAQMLGVPESDGDRFRGFIHRILEKPGQVAPPEDEGTLINYLEHIIEEHREEPRDDLIGYLLDYRVDGEPLAPEHIDGTIALTLLAGIDTTWSAIGASLWHLARHPDDRRRLIEEPELMTFAVEEFLRFYAPVTMARMVSSEVEIGGCPMAVDDWVLLPFPAANRDPEAFEAADEFVIDRERNRHAAFGLGIHRCLGSNLARMELRVAIEEWLARVPDFELADPDAVRWSSGQVRGPRELPVRIVGG